MSGAPLIIPGRFEARPRGLSPAWQLGTSECYYVGDVGTYLPSAMAAAIPHTAKLLAASANAFVAAGNLLQLDPLALATTSGRQLIEALTNAHNPPDLANMLQRITAR